MELIKVRVDGAEFFLSDTEAAPELRASIVDAVRQGGDFVTFSTIGRGPIEVLLTPGVPVRFETVERPDEQVDEWQHEPPSFDIDFLS